VETNDILLTVRQILPKIVGSNGGMFVDDERDEVRMIALSDIAIVVLTWVDTFFFF
jgi:hypothetical protein